MSVQIRDTYLYENKTYYLLARKGRKLEFNPSQFQLHPTSICTACWAGYFCEYEIKEDRLFLNHLYIHCDEDEYPKLNGVPINLNTDDDHYDHCHYDNVQLPIVGSGTCRILLGADCIARTASEADNYWNYETLKEFTFKNGILIDVKDY